MLNIKYCISRYHPALLTLTDTVQYAKHLTFWIPCLGSKIDLTLVWNSVLCVYLSLRCNLIHLPSLWLWLCSNTDTVYPPIIRNVVKEVF